MAAAEPRREVDARTMREELEAFIRKQHHIERQIIADRALPQTEREDRRVRQGSFFNASSENFHLRTPCSQFSLSAEQAVREISGLPAIMANLLVEFYGSGLRGDHLRSWGGNLYQFNETHVNAVRTLIFEHNKSAEESISLLTGKSMAEVTQLMSESRGPRI